MPSRVLEWVLAVILFVTVMSQTYSVGPNSFVSNNDDTNNYEIHFPEEWGPPPPTCTGESMHKVKFNQSGYVNFVQFDTKVPALKGFHSCFWIHLFNPERGATPLSYYFDFDDNSNNLTVLWTGSIVPAWYIQINGYTVGGTSNSKLLANKWHHICASWSGITGEWSLFQDGYLVEYGNNKKSVGMSVDTGGYMVSGQLMNTRNDGMDRGAGIDGYITLLHVDSHPLLHASSPETRQWVQTLSQDCRAVDRGDVIGWLRTARGGYAGTTEMRAKQSCFNF